MDRKKLNSSFDKRTPPSSIGLRVSGKIEQARFLSQFSSSSLLLFFPLFTSSPPDKRLESSRTTFFLTAKKMNVLSIRKIHYLSLSHTHTLFSIERHRAKNRVRSSKNARKKGGSSRQCSRARFSFFYKNFHYLKQLTLIVHRCETPRLVSSQLYKKIKCPLFFKR